MTFHIWLIQPALLHPNIKVMTQLVRAWSVLPLAFLPGKNYEYAEWLGHLNQRPWACLRTILRNSFILLVYCSLEGETCFTNLWNTCQTKFWQTTPVFWCACQLTWYYQNLAVHKNGIHEHHCWCCKII